MSKSLSLILFIVVLFFTSCRQEDDFIRITGTTQGTTFSLICGKKAGLTKGEVYQGVAKIFTGIDYSLSVYNDSSVISRMNRNENVTADRYFKEVFNLSQEMSQLTGGAFDITVGPLVRAWGFGPEARTKFNPSILDSLMQMVGYRKVKLVEGRLVKEHPGIILDVNAIAQGYTVDEISRYFDSLGVENYLIEVGGEVRVKGTKKGVYWKIGIDRPYDNNLTPGADIQAVIELKDKSLATSGNYRKFYEEDGVKYSHTIDPVTGYPARNRLLSATIIAGDCAVADAVATAAMVMGTEKAIEFIENHPGFEAYFIYSGDSGEYLSWISETLRERIREEK
ncbi:MAG: FAD:protein FMN transferase [Bacteroidales bacterium]